MWRGGEILQEGASYHGRLWRVLRFYNKVAFYFNLQQSSLVFRSMLAKAGKAACDCGQVGAPGRATGLGDLRPGSRQLGVLA